jgi:hypothetical protein
LKKENIRELSLHIDTMKHLIINLGDTKDQELRLLVSTLQELVCMYYDSILKQKNGGDLNSRTLQNEKQIAA